MKIVPNCFAILCVAFGLALFSNFSAQAQLTTISDATGDISAGIFSGGGTLDIVKMEVGDTATDVVFRLTVNGNVATTDWGKFMIGIANGKGGATGGTKSGNGWSRPINLDAGTSGGMTHWIGSWVDGGTGANFYTYSGTAWTETAATYSGNFSGFSVVAGAQSVITYTVPKASLGVVNGDTIRFDAYSSGGSTPNSAVDALANPNASIADWPGPYTSSGANLASYTLANTMLNTTQQITFSVNMSHQTLLSNFNPASDSVVVEWGTSFPSANSVTLAAAGSGVYTGTATVSAPQGTSVPYRFKIQAADLNSSPVLETLTPRTFPMPSTALTVVSAYYNNIEGYRDVTFSVNMSVQQALGNFNPATQSVEVRGLFSAWAGTELTAQGSGIYSGTVRISGAAAAVPYKFFAGTYEAGGNRSFTLAFNSDRAPTPAQVLDVVFFSNVNSVRPVTFAVDMGVQAFRGTFTPGTDSVYLMGEVSNWTTGVVMTREGETSIYKATLNLEGAENATLNYKFKSSNMAVGNAGFEGDMDAGISGDTPRVLRLGAASVPQPLTTSTFNNQSEARKITVRVDMSIQQQAGNFNSSTGTVKVGGTFNGWTAVTLAAQGNAIYAGEFVVVGPLSAVEYKFINGDTYESISNRTITTALPNLAASTLDPVYFNNHDVAVAGSTFADAYPDKSMTEVAPNGLTYLANYAFGGDSNTQPILPVQDMSDPDKLQLIVVYRTDDPTLPLSGLRGEATTDLSGAWDLPDVGVTNGDRTGLPDNLTRKVISVDRGSDPKKFLRATVTK